LEDLGFLRPVWTTGPGAVFAGVRIFTGARDFSAGFWTGINNHTVEIVGTSKNQSEYVWRDNIPGKADLYEGMNMTYLTRMGYQKKHMNISCFERIYQRDQDREWTPTLW
jgi:hypothetical protein